MAKKKENELFKIETGIPFPTRIKYDPLKDLLIDTFDKLKNGETIFVPASKLSLGTVQSARKDFSKKRGNSGKLIILRKVDKPIKGTRIWMKIY